jgi:dTDP-4-dehydrorhamnose 3,5-epimerase
MIVGRSSMALRAVSIEGCFEIELPVHADNRGTFRKVFQRSAFLEAGLEADFPETFFTHSNANVLRGMHLQWPPADYAKVVYCVEGAVMDVLLDLRSESRTFGCPDVLSLTARRGNAVYIAPGVAHGFYVVEGPAIMLYQVSAEYVPHLDGGVHWSSVPVPWPTRTPIVSERDDCLPSLSDYVRPLRTSVAERRTIHA